MNADTQLHEKPALPASPGEGSTLYYALLKVPAETRNNVMAVLSLSRALADTLNDVSEPAVAEKKIHWWHEELQRLQDGQARHPATRAVAALPATRHIAITHWLSILSANSEEKFVNAKDDAQYQTRLQQDYNTRVLLCSQMLQRHEKAPLHYWAAGFGQFDRLRHFHRLHGFGYPVFPDESFASLDIEPADITIRDKREQVMQLFRRHITAALSAFERALTEPDPSLGPESAPFYIAATIRRDQLLLWQQQALLPSEAYSTLTPFRKAWLAWRCGVQVKSRYRVKGPKAGTRQKRDSTQ